MLAALTTAFGRAGYLSPHAGSILSAAAGAALAAPFFAGAAPALAGAAPFFAGAAPFLAGAALASFLAAGFLSPSAKFYGAAAA